MIGRRHVAMDDFRIVARPEIPREMQGRFIAQVRLPHRRKWQEELPGLSFYYTAVAFEVTGGSPSARGRGCRARPSPAMEEMSLATPPRGRIVKPDPTSGRRGERASALVERASVPAGRASGVFVDWFSAPCPLGLAGLCHRGPYGFPGLRCRPAHDARRLRGLPIHR
jgi:hypothetical protein